MRGQEQCTAKATFKVNSWRKRLGLRTALLLLVVAPLHVEAHAQLVRSNPADHSAVKSPKRIDVWFTELLEKGFNTMAVYPAAVVPGKATKNLARAAAVVDPKDLTHLSIELPSLSPGDYVVEWRVLSRDGHSAPGRIHFRVVGTR